METEQVQQGGNKHDLEEDVIEFEQPKKKYYKCNNAEQEALVAECYAKVDEMAKNKKWKATFLTTKYNQCIELNKCKESAPPLWGSAFDNELDVGLG